MVRKALQGDLRHARKLHYELLDIMNVNFIESNPIPVKAAMTLMGLIEEHYRLPLVPLGEPGRTRLVSILRQLKLVS
jgi:4-hydroxy-tetrahydrodipicolinate synthase